MQKTGKEAQDYKQVYRQEEIKAKGDLKYRNSVQFHQLTIDENCKVGPRSRPVHAAGMDGQIVNGNPNRRYVKANTNESDEGSFMYYETLGYEIERRTKAGVRIEMGSRCALGEPLTWKGMVLMSCSIENYNRVFNEGPTGNTGQRLQDLMMKRIQKGLLDKRIKVGGLHQSENFQLLNGNDPETFR